jgi:DNA-binding response OmpR family regulator
MRKGELVLKPSLLKAHIRENSQETPVELTAKEFKILYFLAKSEGQVFSRDELVKAVWGDSVHVLSRTVDSHVYGLRKKLRTLAHYIEAVPGVGYRFQSPNGN